MASRSGVITKRLRGVTREQGLGTYKGQAYDLFNGLNYRANGLMMPGATDQTGLTFITRPELNLTRANITHDRELTPMLSANELTVQRGIRALLDPWAAHNGYGSKLINDRLPFMTVLTNTLVSLSGWPDNAQPDYVEPEGIMGETIAVSDGNYRNRGASDLTLTFTNVEGGIIPILFHYIGLYKENVFHKKMFPYPWNVMENRLDYTSRIYRLILDPSRRYVQHILNCGYCYPKTNPIGSLGNFDSSDNFDRSLDKVSIQFRAVGFEFDNPMVITEFNNLMARFNPDLELDPSFNLYTNAGLRIKGNDSYWQVGADQRDLCNFNASPLIHPITQELIWFIRRDKYQEITEEINGGLGEMPDPVVENSVSPIDNTVYGYKAGILDTEVDING